MSQGGLCFPVVYGEEVISFDGVTDGKPLDERVISFQKTTLRSIRVIKFDIFGNRR